MSKKVITINPTTRKEHRAEFVKHNPWTPGKTLGDIAVLIASGEQKLAGPFVLAEPKERTKKAVVSKSDSPTVKANKQASKKPKKAKKTIEDPEFLEKIAEIKRRKEARRKAAKFCHKNGVHPRGKAWEEIFKGERDIATLQGYNDADGYSEHENRKPTKGKVATAVVADVTPESPARKRPHRKNGSFMSKEQTDMYFKLVDSGVTDTNARVAAETLA